MEANRGMIKSTVRILVLVCFLALIGGAGLQAAEYPGQPVKLIVPWAAGGDTDAVM